MSYIVNKQKRKNLSVLACYNIVPKGSTTNQIWILREHIFLCKWYKHRIPFMFLKFGVCVWGVVLVHVWRLEDNFKVAIIFFHLLQEGSLESLVILPCFIPQTIWPMSLQVILLSFPSYCRSSGMKDRSHCICCWSDISLSCNGQVATLSPKVLLPPESSRCPCQEFLSFLQFKLHITLETFMCPR